MQVIVKHTDDLGFQQISITIPPQLWERTGVEGKDGPSDGRLLAHVSLIINGVPLLVEAHGVVEREGTTQRAADDTYAEPVELLQEMIGGAAQTTAMNARKYIIVAIPEAQQ